MSFSSLSIGLSGLRAAQTGITVTQNNIANATTAGYHRQSAILVDAPATRSPAGGSGVGVQEVRRSYNQFLDNTVNVYQNRLAASQAQVQHGTPTMEALTATTGGLGESLSSFFGAASDVANDVGAIAPKQHLLTTGATLAARFQAQYAAAEQAGRDTLQTVAAHVHEVNTYAAQIAQLNQRIAQTSAPGQQPPNDLIDQRGQAITQLGMLIGTTATVENNGMTSIYTADGVPLVENTVAHPLSADAQGGLVSEAGNRRLPTQRLGGAIGGAHTAQDTILQPAREGLNRAAVALAISVNQATTAGSYPDPATGAMTPGAEFFTPVVLKSTDTTADVTLRLTTAPLANENYTATYAGGQFTLTRTSDGATTALAPGDEATLNGVPQGFSLATPEEEGSWAINFQDYAARMQLQTRDAERIPVAAQTGEAGNNATALALARLHTQGVLDNGHTSISDTLIQVGTDAAGKVSDAAADISMYTALTNSANAQRDAVSGVNLDEEAINLTRYQMMYQASAKAIAVTNSLFDSLLSI